MFKWVKDSFSIDCRALAIFRILISLILIFDLIIRSLSLVAHYTDIGTLPLSFYSSIYQNTGWISIHLIGGSILFQSILFILEGIFAVFLLLGYQTRLASIFSWFLLISLHSRNPTILQGGDVMLRVLLFWAMFLPLNLRYSLDSKFRKTKYSDNVISFASAGILLQVAFVYFFSALLKTSKEWRAEGSALYYALELDQFTTYFGKFLLGFPSILKTLTHFTYFLELIGPILLFTTFFSKKIRMGVVFAFILLLTGMALSLNLAHFPFVGIAGLILFLPSSFCDKLSNKLIFLSENGGRWYLKPYTPNKIVNYVALFFIIYIFLWNVNDLGKNVLPDDFEFIAYATRTDQYWNMFSPSPLKEDGWYVIEGRLPNGELIDLFREGALVDYSKPEHVADLYKNERWRKYMMNLWDKSYSHHRPYYLSYLCYDWNRKQPEQKVNHITMNFMLEYTHENYNIGPVEKITLEEAECN